MAEENISNSAKPVDFSVPASIKPIETEAVKAVQTAESAIGGISIRAVLAIILVLALVVYPFVKIPIPQEVSTLAIAVCSFYFGKYQGK